MKFEYFLGNKDVGVVTWPVCFLCDAIDFHPFTLMLGSNLIGLQGKCCCLKPNYANAVNGISKKTCKPIGHSHTLHFPKNVQISLAQFCFLNELGGYDLHKEHLIDCHYLVLNVQ